MSLVEVVAKYIVKLVYKEKDTAYDKLFIKWKLSKNTNIYEELEV